MVRTDHDSFLALESPHRAILQNYLTLKFQNERDCDGNDLSALLIFEN